MSNAKIKGKQLSGAYAIEIVCLKFKTNMNIQVTSRLYFLMDMNERWNARVFYEDNFKKIDCIPNMCAKFP